MPEVEGSKKKEEGRRKKEEGRRKKALRLRSGTGKKEGKNYAQCPVWPMPCLANSQFPVCPMPHAQCPMPRSN